MAVAGELPPPAAVLPSFAAACALVCRRYSCLVVAPHRRHVALPPRFLGRKRTGICAQLDAELLRYSESLQGVPVAYDNVKVVGELGNIHDDQGFIHLDVEADFVIFSPKKGKKMVGVINKVAPSHIGCLIHGCFNASIPKPEHMSAAEWQQLGFKIGDELKFQVVHLDSDAAGVFFIRGQLTKTSMQPKRSDPVTDAVTDGTNGEQIQNFDNEKNDLNDSRGDNVTEDRPGEADSTVGGNTEEQSIVAENEICDDKKKKKKKKKHKQEEQEHVLPASDSSGYQSDLKKSKKKKRKHCEIEESELLELSQEPKAKKKRN
ncbi:DNA-directed RNA polymerase I subunit RPA43 [Tympanuchus pallidicinctus]|uniref:DNA-directed RNA polymerase I subunit RPA43 n=1 Tax=Tympanuchus pallidicinctus TaxID=109042 RepID=UPI002286E323|nr:DNA-directed RNA polymerase I subunit RPA43 [Tympanuchus pallidicinctus]